MTAPTAPEKARKGRNLAPDLTKAPGVVKKSRYWIGIHETRQVGEGPADYAPFFNETVGPVTLQITYTPHLGRDPDSGEERRAEYAGRMHDLTPEQVDQFEDILSRSIVRWERRASDNDRKPWHGRKATLKTADEIKALGSKYRGFDPRPTDEPLANWIYVRRMPDDAHEVARGTPLPAPVIETGIEYP